LNVGDRVLTRGTEPEDTHASQYPPGLPIGQITRIDNEGTDTQEIHLHPFADMRSLDFVQILTRPRGPKG
ncbi:MAG TPA: rod shape-determining protein MreC, partial [Solirubrobacteraceae bacterium]|nr:rod shape-determining protein MreC [Solirubrobacteraceae bacterium]